MNNTKKSTSLSTLSADTTLHKHKKILWLLFNFINNIDLKFGQKLIKSQQFYPKYFDYNFMKNKPSPSRFLSDMFWLNLDWKKIKDRLGGEINILDSGCGNGNYFYKLNELSKNNISKYNGFDLFESDNWINIKKENSNTDFFQSDSSDIYEKIKDMDLNMFISQSAIEHFIYDLSYFEDINKYVQKSKKKVIQIHLFPAPASLKLYLFHGVRQYSLRNISKILSIFDSNNSYYKVYKLGDNFLNKLHFECITKPELLKIKSNFSDENYLNKMKDHVTKNLYDSKNPSFYALILHHNCNRKII